MVRKVAIIIERADVALGGAERSMFEVAEALSAFGPQVDLLAAKGQTRSSNVQVLCERVPGKRVSLAAFAEALKRHLARTDYDIVHSVLPFDFADLYQPRGGTYAESLLRHAASYPNALLRCGKRLTAFANRRRAGLLHAERELCHGTEGPVIAALSQYVVAQLQEHYATDPARIVLTLNGVKVDKPVDPSAAGRLRTQILSALRVDEADNPALFLFAAHNFRLKGLDRLIRAMQMVSEAAAERPAYLIVVGAGRSGRYQRLAQRLGIEKRILFLGASPDVRSVLSVSDIGILPTFYDPSSRFILEALAAGKPVITTRFNGATDHFTDGRHGKVVDSPEDIPALAEAIRHFTVPAHIERAARAIRDDHLAEKISIQRVAKDLLGVYDGILERKGHR